MRIHGLPVSVDERTSGGGEKERAREKKGRKEEYGINRLALYAETEVEPLRQVRDRPLNAIPVRFLRGTSGFRLVRQSGTVHLAFLSYSSFFI